MSLACDLAGRCGGCPLLPISLEQQSHLKQQTFLDAWHECGLPMLPSVMLHVPQAQGVRARVDLTLRTGTAPDARPVLGFYTRTEKQLLEVTRCPMLNPELDQWLRAFGQDLPNIAVGSIRLRVSPTGERGVWLDFSHLHTQALLESQDWLERLRQRAHVEIGQRHKWLERRGEKLHLARQPQLRPWFNTWLGEAEQEAALYCTVGSFTQPGFEVNRVLVRQVRRALLQLDPGRNRRWLELGAGIGNFTLPLLAEGLPVTAVELEAGALKGLAHAAQVRGLQTQLRLAGLDFQHPNPALKDMLEQHDALLVDPPRSGLGKLTVALAELLPSRRPRALLYVSCHAESLRQDLQQLLTLGYALRTVEGVDQFPFSAHAEWIVTLEQEQPA